jgi:hypothetical protein
MTIIFDDFRRKIGVFLFKKKHYYDPIFAQASVTLGEKRQSFRRKYFLIITSGPLLLPASKVGSSTCKSPSASWSIYTKHDFHVVRRRTMLCYTFRHQLGLILSCIGTKFMSRKHPLSQRPLQVLSLYLLNKVNPSCVPSSQLASSELT